MSPKEIANKIRFLAMTCVDKPVTDSLYKLAKEVDPPKPQRPEPGTVVRFADGDLGIVANGKIIYVDKKGFDTEVSWRDVQECVGYDYKSVHILAGDEVAVKRSQIQALLGKVGE